MHDVEPVRQVHDLAELGGDKHDSGARRELITSFDWWMAPGLWRAGTALHKAGTLRIDIRPEDFNRRPARIRAGRRTELGVLRLTQKLALPIVPAERPDAV